MVEYGLNTPRAALLERQGRYSEAAESQLSDGNIYKAIQLFLRDSHNSASALRAAQTVLDVLWATFTLVEESTQPPNAATLNCRLPPDRFLQLIEVLHGLLTSDTMTCKEMEMFQAIHRRDMNYLLQLRHSFLDAEYEAMLFVILDSIFFDPPPDLGSLSFVEIASCFKVFLQYARILQRFTCHPHPCNLPALQRLFTFTVYDEDHYILHEGSCLRTEIKYVRTDQARNGWKGLVILRRDLEHRIKSTLRERLLGRVMRQNEVCHNLLSIRTCFLFAASRRCHCYQCPQYHADPREDGATTYNLLVRIHLLQILIYHTLYAAKIPSRDLFMQQRVWLRRFYEALYPPHFTLGSVHVLSPQFLPELKEGRSVIVVWIQDFLNHLIPGREGSLHVFLSNLFRSTRLAVLLDHRAAYAGLHLIPCAYPGSPQSLRSLWRTDTYVVKDLLLAMQGKVPDSLDRGVLLLNHILSRRLPIDVVVLCDFMDNLCGSLIMARGLQTSGTLHSVMLPKSWIARMLPTLRVLENKSTALAVAQYTSYFKDLLQQVCSGHDAAWTILVENVDLSKPGANITRNVLVARMCRNLCLWGYNQRSEKLRQDIVAIISAIGECERMPSSFTSPYVYATSWSGLARAVRSSTVGSDLDEMVQLWHTAVPMPNITLPSVRHIPFAQNTDLEAILNIGQLRELVVPPSLPAAASRSTDELLPPETKTRVPTNTDGNDRTRLEGIEERRLNGQRARQDTDGTDNIGIQRDAPSLTPRERAAATLIAETFKQYCTRVRAQRDTLQERKLRIYMQFRTHAQKKEWSTSMCRVLFLGPLPHAYFAIECTKDHLGTAIARTKAELKSVNHRRLEDMQGTMERLTQLFQEVSQFHQDWHPSASVYDRCDDNIIRSCIRSADDFLRTVEGDMEEAFEWREDVDLAMSVAARG
ncbi:hypothetical protein BC628DRAFT_1543902 [Trametes gibbosa]|nr:hypothetical protein BC628DRAFT_1543902 [Trametes gibbosa]